MVCCEGLGGAELVNNAEEMKTYSSVSKSCLASEKHKLSHLLVETGLMEPLDIDQTQQESLSDIMHLLWEYTSRVLTFDSDSLRAFAGIQRCFNKPIHPIYDIQGLPLLLNGQSTTAMEKNFVAVLCWHHRWPVDARRKSEFPWTWAGWTGSIDFAYKLDDFENLILFLETISIEFDNGIIASFSSWNQEIYSQHKSTYNKTNHFHKSGTNTKSFPKVKAIIFNAPVLTKDSFSFENIKDWNTGRWMGMYFEQRLNGRINITMPFSPLFLLNGLVEGTLSCILLGFNTFSETSQAHILLVQWHDVNTAHQIGKLTARIDGESRCPNVEVTGGISSYVLILYHALGKG
jgi:hypothetical protein